MKKYFAILIAFVPFNFFRLFLYRRLLDYRIVKGAKIAPFTLIIAEHCEIGKVSIGFLNYISAKKVNFRDDVRIGKLNRFKWLEEIYVGEGTTIVTGNVAFGTRPGISPFEGFQKLYLGKDCVITNRHLLDVSDELIIGDNVTIAGEGSQFWTHGFDLQHVKIQAGIKVGNRVYIGSRCMVLGGAHVANDVVIGAGTTVARSIDHSGFYVSSGLVRKSDVPNYTKTDALTDYNGFKFVRRILPAATQSNITISRDAKL
ncbi:hypothetical protein [Methylomicrobium sp. Wu6]|uniref:acyltransferase n=1 Tax=Methylomicrobium sp. Wu6 TaxID=3107928 RepID=UPI002DD68B33|nr:hypothetical protein [Methylomicrobium sp. Wu6]MEC4747769.1 hypothetical protein [Methylomicrobium sp. Wu6]